MSLISGAAAAPRAPYALEPTEFPFPALATMAGRAPLGGPREIALACFLVGRIAAEAAAANASLTAEQRQTRAQGAKHWLASAAIPAGARAALSRLADSTVQGEKGPIRECLDSVMTVTANQLDLGARLELGRLAQIVAK